MAGILRRYFKALHGERKQDVQHMIDVCCIETPHQLQGTLINFDYDYKLYQLKLI